MPKGNGKREEEPEVVFSMPEDPMVFPRGSLLRIKGNGVNIRNQPALSGSEVVATLPDQTEILVIESGEDLVEVEGFGYNFWYKISAESQEEGGEEISGWVFGAFLSD